VSNEDTRGKVSKSRAAPTATKNAKGGKKKPQSGELADEKGEGVAGNSGASL